MRLFSDSGAFHHDEVTEVITVCEFFRVTVPGVIKQKAIVFVSPLCNKLLKNILKLRLRQIFFQRHSEVMFFEGSCNILHILKSTSERIPALGVGAVTDYEGIGVFIQFNFCPSLRTGL